MDKWVAGLTRPSLILISELVVFFFSSWISFAWAILYSTFSAIPLIFQTTYGFQSHQADLVFAALAIGSLLGLAMSVAQQRWARQYSQAYQALEGTPECRLFFPCFEAALLPIGCTCFAVAGAYSSVHWIVPALGIGCATMGIFSVLLAVSLYLADVYGPYASSALAAHNLCRTLVGGVFPLFTTTMFEAMTFQGAGGLLRAVGSLLLAVPWVLLLYGRQIRARSRLANAQTQAD